MFDLIDFDRDNAIALDIFTVDGDPPAVVVGDDGQVAVGACDYAWTSG